MQGGGLLFRKGLVAGGWALKATGPKRRVQQPKGSALECDYKASHIAPDMPNVG